MDQSTLARLRPASRSSADLDAAIAAVATERNLAELRLAGARDRRAYQLLHGDVTSIRAASDAIDDAKVELEQIEALAAAHRVALAETHAKEGAASATLDRQLSEAEAAANRFRKWITTDYLKHAKAIADGLQLETKAATAIQAVRDTVRDNPALTLPDLPVLTRGYQSTAPTEYGVGFTHYVNLPAPNRGPAIHIGRALHRRS